MFEVFITPIAEPDEIAELEKEKKRSSNKRKKKLSLKPATREGRTSRSRKEKSANLEITEMSISDGEIRNRNRNKAIRSGMDINVMEKGIISPRRLEQQPPVDSRMEAKACWEVGKAIL
ncbi:hypothetical protein NC652_028814 [Populus alba x Populus x berolinensis]|nr:hypothetical protein NC651_027825 [Populus alba x Populus x berolinensis]KAJ6887663.1 hypothetical protein NC652_028814 [Populus alba x Populus x berolinensis]